MNLIMLAAIGVVVAWLLLEDAAASSSPAVIIAGAGESGFREGSSSDVAATLNVGEGAFLTELRAKGAAQEEAILSGLASGASFGYKLGGPIGAVVGAVVSLLFTLPKPVDDFTHDPNAEPPISPLPVEAALPFRPDGTIVNSLGVGVWVPAPPPNPPWDSLAVTFEVSALASLLGHPAAVLACRRAGMFAWRPGDFSTPFSQALNIAAPWLAAYERDHIRLKASPPLAPYSWQGVALDPLATEFNPHDGAALLEAEARRIILRARRLAAAYAHPGPEVVFRAEEMPAAWRRLSDYFERSTNLAKWIGNLVKEGRARGGISYACKLAGVPMLVPSPYSEGAWQNWGGLSASSGPRGGVFRPRFPARKGLPGAWALRSPPEAEGGWSIDCWGPLGRVTAKASDFVGTGLWADARQSWEALTVGKHGAVAWDPVANGSQVTAAWDKILDRAHRAFPLATLARDEWRAAGWGHLG